MMLKQYSVADTVASAVAYVCDRDRDSRICSCNACLPMRFVYISSPISSPSYIPPYIEQRYQTTARL